MFKVSYGESIKFICLKQYSHFFEYLIVLVSIAKELYKMYSKFIKFFDFSQKFLISLVWE